MRKLGFAASVLMLIALSAPPARGATSTTTCTGVLFPGTVSGNVEVPAGESCVLFGTTVTGNVSARASNAISAAPARPVGGAR